MLAHFNWYNAPMQPYLIDTHCHLHLMKPEESAAALAALADAGVKKLVNVACSLGEFEGCEALARAHDFIWTTAGIHPTELGTDLKEDLNRVREFAKGNSKVVAIGEIGLDYFHQPYDKQKQTDYFLGQLEIARELNLPVILHCRSGKNAGENSESYGDLIALLKRANFFNVISHCFSGNEAEAATLVEMGAMISFAGIVTYPQAEVLRRTIKTTPLEKILIETDSPFLTPQAYRGKRNQPAYVLEAAKVIAEVKGLSLDEVKRVTSENAEKIFKI
jgi:TatD DNase family protein